MVRTKKQVERLPVDKQKLEKQCVPRSSAVNARITSYFSMRKRKNDDSCTDKTAVDVLGKKLRRDVNITDVETADHCKAVKSGVFCTPLGIFDNLPRLLFDAFAENAAMSTLVQLAQSSRQCSQRIIDFLLSNSGRSRFSVEAAAMKAQDEHTQKDSFCMFGQLLKAATCTRATSIRINILGNFYHKSSVVVPDVNGWGRLLHAFAARWDFAECESIVKFVLRMNGGRLGTEIKEVLTAAPGAKPLLEMTVRNALRGLLLDQRCEDEKERSFWMSCLLRSFSTLADQSRIMMILYTPTMDENGQEVLDWRSLCDRAVESAEDAHARLGPLADAIHRLYKTRHLQAPYAWNNNDLFNTIEEISTCPEPWSFDNFVALLLERPVLIPTSLTARMTHGYADEAGQMLVAMRTLLHRWGHEVSTLTEPFLFTMRTLPASLRRTLFSAISDAHSKSVKELCASHVEITEELNAHQSLLPLLLKAVTLL